MPEAVRVVSNKRIEDRRMLSKKTSPDLDSRDKIIGEARRHQAEQEKTYRGQALKLYPWICARCGREFGGKKLRELTVHHKDHNHDNNPPDGSNWELLCLYCHDSEHSRSLDRAAYAEPVAGDETDAPATYKAFADLKSLVKVKK